MFLFIKVLGCIHVGGGYMYYIYCTVRPSPLLAKTTYSVNVLKVFKKNLFLTLSKKKHKIVDLNCLHLRKYLYCQVVLKKKTYFDFNDILIFN